MKFRFPIVIIHEDYRSENTSGLGIRALAQAIETEGFEVLGVTSYGDLSQFQKVAGDNDGLWTSMHAMGEVYNYAATGYEYNQFIEKQLYLYATLDKQIKAEAIGKVRNDSKL
jgi:hypothetical protein